MKTYKPTLNFLISLPFTFKQKVSVIKFQVLIKHGESVKVTEEKSKNTSYYQLSIWCVAQFPFDSYSIKRKSCLSLSSLQATFFFPLTINGFMSWLKTFEIAEAVNISRECLTYILNEEFSLKKVLTGDCCNC